jgi:hypothetical protein
LLHARGQVRRLADGGVVHVEVTADGAHHDLARVETDADLDVDAVRSTDALGVAPDRLLHSQRRKARAGSVVFVRERRPEERHDPSPITWLTVPS